MRDFPDEAGRDAERLKRQNRMLKGALLVLLGVVALFEAPSSRRSLMDPGNRRLQEMGTRTLANGQVCQDPSTLYVY
eukprot:1801773-Prymnesium_polylepis.1